MLDIIMSRNCFRRWRVLFICFLLFGCTLGINGPAVTLDTGANYNISWTHDDSAITFTISVRTEGWVGFGLSPTGGMTNSDIVMINSAGISDRHTGSETVEPTIDAEQDWTLISRDVTSGITTIEMSRPLSVCRENREDISINSDTLRLIWSYGVGDSFGYHLTSRGTKSLYLLGVTDGSFNRPPDALELDILSENVTIPSDSTTYWCTLFKLPTLAQKHHVISFEPIVQEGNELFVHHALVYGCYFDIDGDTLINGSMHSQSCFGPNMPEDMQRCRSTIFSWAIGGGRFVYPAEAGYALGTADAPNFVMLEVHYDNPNSLSGVQDSSGLRLTYTPTLRTYDLDVLQVGSVYSILIPPGKNTTDVPYLCSQGCTQALPEDGVTLFAGLLHSHLLGRKITLRHSPANGNSYILLRDHAYDFNFQETRTFDSIKFNRGDSLQITCDMDSTGLTAATVGGLGTTDEMCLAYLYYYPKTDLADCGSVPVVAQGPAASVFYSTLGAPSPTSFSIAESISTVVWDNAKALIVQESYFNHDHASVCTNKARSGIQDNYQAISASVFSKGDNILEQCDDGTGSAFHATVSQWILLLDIAVLYAAHL